MKKALAIGLAAVMAVSMSAPVMASDDSEGGAGIAKEDLRRLVQSISEMRSKNTLRRLAGIDEMIKDGAEIIR